MQSDLISIEQLIRSNDLRPLSLNVPSSPTKCQDDTDVDEDSSIHESTPIKSQTSLAKTNKPTTGLLAYSTPVGTQQQQPFTSLANKSATRKPRVNFHSIDDIVNSVVSKGKWSSSDINGQRVDSFKSK